MNENIFFPRISFLLLILLAYSLPSFSQCSCNNIGFENNSLGCWNLKYGKFWGGDRYIWSTTTSSENSQHTITDVGDYDPIADCVSNNFLPQVAPGSQHSLRLGDSRTGRYTASASVSFVVSQATSLFQLQYAVVFSDPGHPVDEQPRFEVIVGTDCGDYFVVSDASIPGFQSCSNDWRVRPWTTVGIDLSSNIGQVATIEFISADCAQSGHGGYAYIDASCVELDIDIGNYCPGDASITLTAPDGFSEYHWTNLSNGQTSQGQQLDIQNPQGGETYQVEIVSVTGCSAFLEYTLPIIPSSSEITIDYIGDNAFCVGGGGTINISGSNIGQIYLNGTVQNNTSIEVKPTITTTYNVEAFGTGECANDASNSFILEVFPNPQVELISSDAIVCPGGTVTISYQEENNTQYEWIGLNQSNVSSLDLFLDSTTTYTVIATSPNGCTATDEITVYSIEEEEIAYELDEITVCPPGSPTVLYVSIDNVSSITCSYLLYVSPGNADTVLRNYEISNRDFTLYPEEDMVIPITFWSEDSCSMIIDTIHINVLDNAPTIDLATNQYVVCKDDTLSIEVIGDFDSLICSPPPIDITNNIITIAPSLDVIYEIQGLRLFCESAEETIFVFVKNKPNYSIDSDSVLICQDDSITLSVTTDFTNSITWSENNSNQASLTVKPSQSEHFVFQIATAEGCVVEDSIYVDALSQETIDYYLDTLTICKGTYANLGVKSSENITIFWPHLNATLESVVVAPSVSTFFEVEITSESGCTTITDSILVNIETGTVMLNPISDTMICPQDSLLILISGNNFSDVHWEGIDTLATELYLPLGTSDTFIVRGIPIDNEECPSPPIIFTINSSPAPDVVIESISDPLCPDDEVTLNVVISSTIQSFFWADTGESDTNRIVTIEPNISNIFSVIVLDENDCESEFSIDLGFFDPIILPMYEAENVTICDGEIVVIDLNPSNHGDIIWHQIPNYFADTILYEGVKDTLFTFDIYDSTNCQFVRDSILVTIDDLEIEFPDTLEVCKRDNLLLPFPDNVDSIYWQEIDTTVFENFSVLMDSGIVFHSIVYNTNGCAIPKEVNVLVYSSDDLIVPVPEMSICIGDTLILEATSSLSVSWYENNFSNPISNTELVQVHPDVTTIYIVEASNDFCSFSDTVLINVLIPEFPLNLGIDVYDVCEGDSLHVSLNCDAVYNVMWDVGQEGCEINLQAKETAYLHFTYEDEYGCIQMTDSVFVKVTELPFVSFSEESSCVRPRGIIQPLDTCASCSFIWHDGTRGTAYVFDKENAEDNLIISASNRCGMASDTLFISSIGNCDFFAPNTFTPNGDGINDKWKVFFGCNENLITDFSLKIYNRWGGEVFSANEMQQVWNGKEAQSGVYLWFMTFYDPICDKKYIEKGSITITK